VEQAFYRSSYIEVDLDAVKHNITQYRRVLPADTQLLAAVKADAYGHGAVMVSRAALEAGATHLGVAFVDEGIQLREAEIRAPILVFGYTPPYAIAKALTADLTLTVYQLPFVKQVAEVAAKLGKRARVHLKVDTGMGRLGVHPEEVLSFVQEIQKWNSIYLEGIYTHFATADEQDTSYFIEQQNRFMAVLQQLEQFGINIRLRHAANSAATLRMEHTTCNLVRIGIGLYGFQDVPDDRIELLPVLRVKSTVTHVKHLPANSGVSYGKTYTTAGGEWIATIPLGYADGIPRQLSNGGEMLLHGIRVPIVGRVCMDQLMLRVDTAMPVSVGDEVVWIGKQEKQEITAGEIAAQLGTIHYEIVTRLGARLPRIYLEKGKIVTVYNSLLKS
jgi:alanine racemase